MQMIEENYFKLDDKVEDYLPEVKFVELVRDGNNVISSSIRRDFYSETDLNERLVMWSNRIDDLRIPWFIDQKYKKLFRKWNHQTRVAHIWRIQTQCGLDFASKNKNILRFKLEQFAKSPNDFTKEVEKFLRRKRTEITNKNIKSVKTFKQRVYPDNTPDVLSPEKEKFISLRKKLGYL